MGKTELREEPTYERDENDDAIYEKQVLPALITLTGFISTSLDQKTAEQFAWSNPETGYEATLFKIMWKYERDYYVMNMSALPQE